MSSTSPTTRSNGRPTHMTEATRPATSRTGSRSPRTGLESPSPPSPATSSSATQTNAPTRFVVSREVEAEPEAGGGKKGAGQSTIEEFGGGPHISVQLKSVRGSVAVLLVSVPEAGRLRAVATARPPGGGARQTVARARGRASGKAKVRIELRLAKRFRPAGDEKLKARAKVSFTPLTPGKHLTDSVKIVFSAH